MNSKPYALKDSKYSYAWFALATCISYAEAECAWSADVPVSKLEPNTSAVIGSPVTDVTIPADNAIGAILLSRRHPLLLRADFGQVSEFVNQIYLDSNFRTLWFNGNASEKNLQDLIALLSNATSDGLSPANYDADRLKEWISNPSSDSNVLAAYDVALTVSLVRYLHDLRQGQVQPRDVQYSAHIAPKPPLDVAGLLNQHLASQTLNELVAQFEPKNKQYQGLKKILNGLQKLRDQADSDAFKPDKVLRLGDKHSQITALRRRLKMMGELADDIDADSDIYDNSLVAAVRKVQQQQGLKADGVIGPATASVFNQPSTEKISQIELAMERARWIPDTGDGPMILVNIPAFELWAYNSADDQSPLNMKVVVGKSPDNQTPVLSEDMKYLEFMPYWNIPMTIFKKEILPKTANNKEYLASQDIELIRHQNSDERGGGSYIRARQRPGKKNPLGRVKFVFPNTADVYLHDTPGRTAFSRQRRDLSHGCVRVSEPERLAEFVLGDQEGWDKEAIKQAMSAPKTRHVTLKRAVPVLFYYGTVFIDHENQLRFYPDVYGLDEQLKKLLSEERMASEEGRGSSNQAVKSEAMAVAVRP